MLFLKLMEMMSKGLCLSRLLCTDTWHSIFITFSCWNFSCLWIL